MKFILAFINLLILCIVFSSSRRVKTQEPRRKPAPGTSEEKPKKEIIAHLAQAGESCGNPNLPPTQGAPGAPVAGPHGKDKFMRKCVKGYTCLKNPKVNLDAKLKGVGSVCVKNRRRHH